MTEGVALNRAGNYSAAIPALQHALTIAEGSKTAYLELVKTLDSLAGAYAEIGQVAEAQRLFRRSLAIVESNEGRSSLAYAVVLASLCGTLEESRASEETITLLREAETGSRGGLPCPARWLLLIQLLTRYIYGHVFTKEFHLAG